MRVILAAILASKFIAGITAEMAGLMRAAMMVATLYIACRHYHCRHCTDPAPDAPIPMRL